MSILIILGVVLVAMKLVHKDAMNEIDKLEHIKQDRIARKLLKKGMHHENTYSF